MIYELLDWGAENALSRRDLVAITGLTDREVRRVVARERKRGLPIVTNTERGGGYYLPEGPEELARFIRSLRHRAVETAAAAAAMEATLMEALGQETIGGWFDG